MSLMSRKQDTKASTQAAARAARLRATEQAARAKAAAAGARRRASDTAAQFTPLADSARMTATQSAYRARRWAAPRLDQAGKAVQDRIGPGVAEMLSDAARRIEPARQRSRRWPMLVAGIAMLAAGGAAAYLLNRRAQADRGSESPAPAMPAASSGELSADTATADVNGQVRTP